MTKDHNVTTAAYTDAIDRLMEVRSTLIAVVDISPGNAGRGTIRNIEQAIAARMPVYVFNGDGSPRGERCLLSDCYPDDPDGVSECLDALARHERFHGGGGAAEAFQIERCGFAGTPE